MQDYEFGGMQVQFVVERACLAYFIGANVATTSYPILTIGQSNLLLACGSADQVNRFVRPMMSGQFLGTICLSVFALNES